MTYIIKRYNYIHRVFAIISFHVLLSRPIVLTLPVCLFQNPIYKDASEVMRLSLPGGVYSPYDTSLSSYPYATG